MPARLHREAVRAHVSRRVDPAVGRDVGAAAVAPVAHRGDQAADLGGVDPSDVEARRALHRDPVVRGALLGGGGRQDHVAAPDEPRVGAVALALASVEVDRPRARAARCRACRPARAPCRPRGSTRRSRRSRVRARRRDARPLRVRRPRPSRRPCRRRRSPGPQRLAASRVRTLAVSAGEPAPDATTLRRMEEPVPGTTRSPARSAARSSSCCRVSVLASAAYAILSLFEAPIKGTVVAAASQSPLFARPAARRSCSGSRRWRS